MRQVHSSSATLFTSNRTADKFPLKGSTRSGFHFLFITFKAGLKRAYNFSGGPATLPLAVLEKVRDELLDYRGTGMSVMEMSHRSPEYEEINSRAEQLLRRLMAIPEEYAVIFLQGGGSMQFTMMPLNLHVDGKPVDVLHTGMWTAKAIAELKKSAPYRIAATSEA